MMRSRWVAMCKLNIYLLN
uniref:Uncharacterized protein n=1 Tax=Anguilla anguilla TaxID=7936 RepID=A0A0E9WG39_ANGAN